MRSEAKPLVSSPKLGILKGCEMLVSHPFRMQLVIDLYQGFRAARSTPGYHLLPLPGHQLTKHGPVGFPHIWRRSREDSRNRVDLR
jgi:hypothetical protein